MPERATSPGPFVAGYDGSMASRAAVRFAKALRAGGDGQIVAATVYRDPHGLRALTSAEARAAMTAALRDEAAAVLEGLDDEEVRKEPVPGDSPAEGLHRLAVGEQAQLVAVGVTHRSALGRLLVGGVGDRLLHGAPCPVAVVPDGWDGRPLARVGVAFDGRIESGVALRAGHELALRLGAELEVIGVYEPAALLWLTSPGPAPPVWEVDDLHAGFDQELRDAVVGLDLPTPPRVRAVSGLPGPALVDATNQGIDLLVTGSRGYGPIGGVLLGSVSRYVADHAACPLIVVPREADGPGSAPPAGP